MRRQLPRAINALVNGFLGGTACRRPHIWVTDTATLPFDRTRGQRVPTIVQDMVKSAQAAAGLVY